MSGALFFFPGENRTPERRCSSLFFPPLAITSSQPLSRCSPLHILCCIFPSISFVPLSTSPPAVIILPDSTSEEWPGALNATRPIQCITISRCQLVSNPLFVTLPLSHKINIVRGETFHRNVPSRESLFRSR